MCCFLIAIGYFFIYRFLNRMLCDIHNMQHNDYQKLIKLISIYTVASMYVAITYVVHFGTATKCTISTNKICINIDLARKDKNATCMY